MNDGMLIPPSRFIYNMVEEGINYDRVCLAIYRAITENVKGCYRIFLEYKPTKDTVEVTIYIGHKRRIDFDVDVRMPTNEITDSFIKRMQDWGIQ